MLPSQIYKHGSPGRIEKDEKNSLGLVVGLCGEDWTEDQRNVLLNR